MVILPILTGLIFLVTLGFIIAASYFFILAPMQRQKLKTRLAAVQQMTMHSTTPEDDILRREMLSDIPGLSKLLSALPIVARLQLLLQQAAIEMQIAAFLLIVVSGALLGLIVTMAVPLAFFTGLVLIALLGGAPFLVAYFRRAKRFAKFEEQFPDALELLARAIRSGHAITTAFSLIAEEMAQPVAEEFRAVHQQQSLGLPLRLALENMATRVPLADVRIFASVLHIQKDTGGNLGEILDNLSGVVRERFKILRDVQVLTAEGRLSMYVLIGMPFFVAGAMYWVNPDSISLLATDPLGQKMVIGASFMMVIGYLIIRKMVRIKV